MVRDGWVGMPWVGLCVPWIEEGTRGEAVSHSQHPLVMVATVVATLAVVRGSVKRPAPSPASRYQSINPCPSSPHATSICISQPHTHTHAPCIVCPNSLADVAEVDDIGEVTELEGSPLASDDELGPYVDLGIDTGPDIDAETMDAVLLMDLQRQYGGDGATLDPEEVFGPEVVVRIRARY